MDKVTQDQLQQIFQQGSVESGDLISKNSTEWLKKNGLVEQRRKGDYMLTPKGFRLCHKEEVSNSKE